MSHESHDPQAAPQPPSQGATPSSPESASSTPGSSKPTDNTEVGSQMPVNHVSKGPQPPMGGVSSGFQSFGVGPEAGTVDHSGTYTGGYSATPGYATAPGGAVSTPQKKRGWIVAIVLIVAFCLVTMFGMWSCSNAIMGAATTTTNDADLLTSEAVAVINVDSTIQYDGTTCSPEGLKEQLDIAADNSLITAVVLRVNSGGGVAAAGEEMATYIREFKEATGKPVVVSSAATNSSAAYEISSQADYIYVAKTTAIGAIGTAIQFMDYSGLMELLGITTENIISSDGKDSTYGTRALTDEERAYYQAQVDQINETFIETVAEGRGMSTDEVRALATGLTFTGIDAVDNGLADEIGTLEDAVSKAASLAGSSSIDTITLDRSSSNDWSAVLDLLAQSNTTLTAQDVASALKELDGNGSITQ